MRLSQYAKQMGVSYRTAFRWWKAGKLDAYQLDTGTIIVREPVPHEVPANVALYARVSSADQKEDMERQMQRLKDYAAAKGYHVTRTVSELASGLNDSRPKFLKLLTDKSIGVIVVEQRDRATRFGLTYIEQLMQMQGRRLEVIFPSETDNDLVDDFSRIYGRRTSKRRAEKIKQCVEQVMQAEEETC